VRNNYDWHFKIFIVVLEAKEEIIGKVVDGQRRLLLFRRKMGVIAEGQNPCVCQLGLQREPIPWPKKVQISVFAP
jgi:hypothetical protein